MDPNAYIPILYGDINGQNIFDHDEMDMEDNYGESMYSSWNYSPSPKNYNNPKPHYYAPSEKYWRTGSGEMIKVKNMTDKHLENSIAYCKRHNNLPMAEILFKEQESRLFKKEISMKYPPLKCQFCQKTMTTKFISLTDDPESGNWWPEKEFRYACSCGAMGPIIKTILIENNILD